MRGSAPADRVILVLLTALHLAACGGAGDDDTGGAAGQTAQGGSGGQAQGGAAGQAGQGGSGQGGSAAGQGGAGGSTAGMGGGPSVGPVGSYHINGSGNWPEGTAFRLDVAAGGAGGYVAWLWGQTGLTASGDAMYDPSAKLGVQGLTVSGPFLLGHYGFAIAPNGQVSGMVSGAMLGPGSCKQNGGQPIVFSGTSGPDTTPPKVSARSLGALTGVTLPWDRIEVLASEGVDAAAFVAATAVTLGGQALVVSPDVVTQGQTATLRVATVWPDLIGKSLGVTVAGGLKDPSGNASLPAAIDLPVASLALAKVQSTLDTAGPHPGFVAKTACGSEASCLSGPWGAKLAVLLDSAGATTLRVRYRVPSFLAAPIGSSKGHLVATVADATGKQTTVDVATFSTSGDWNDALVPLAAGSALTGVVIEATTDPVTLGQCQPTYAVELARIAAE